MIQILVNGFDIYAKGLVPNIENLTELRTYKRSLFILNELELKVDNTQNDFSINNPVSFLWGVQWLYTDVLIYDGTELLWSGILTNIYRNTNSPKFATLIIKDNLAEKRNKVIEYVSPTWETPAQAFINLCTQESFSYYDNTIANNSNLYYINNSIYMKFNFLLEENTTFQQAIEKIAEYGNADIYDYKGQVIFEVWQPTSTGKKATFYDTKNHFYIKPVISADENSLINEFNIRYFEDQEIAATDADNNNIAAYSRQKYGTKTLPPLDTNEGQIIFKDLTTALAIGEGRIRRTHKDFSTTFPKPLDMIEFSIDRVYAENIDIKSIIGIYLQDEAWEDQLFRINEYTDNKTTPIIPITAYSLPS